MRESTWQQRVDALGRGRYKRYDESTATKLDEGAVMLISELGGDLRSLRPQGPDGVDDLLTAIADFPRIGPVGAGIFVQEVQEVWPVGPYFGSKALAAAVDLGLPADPADLAQLSTAAENGSVARLAASLVKRPGDDARR